MGASHPFGVRFVAKKRILQKNSLFEFFFPLYLCLPTLKPLCFQCFFSFLRSGLFLHPLLPCALCTPAQLTASQKCQCNHTFSIRQDLAGSKKIIKLKNSFFRFFALEFALQALKLLGFQCFFFFVSPNYKKRSFICIFGSPPKDCKNNGQIPRR